MDEEFGMDEISEDEVSTLYEKILDNEDWAMEDLDRLMELVRAEGYLSGVLNGKHLLRECYNVITGFTGLDAPTAASIPGESSLCRMVREFINT